MKIYAAGVASKTEIIQFSLLFMHEHDLKRFSFMCYTRARSPPLAFIHTYKMRISK